MKTKLIVVVLVSLAGFSLTGCKSGDLGGLRGMLDQGDLPLDTIVAGLKEALEVGTDRTVDKLSKTGGYANDPALRIGLPGDLDKFAKVLRGIGLGDQVDLLQKKMNEAAESAATQAAPVFVDAIKQMTFEDAKKILDGHETAATDFFKEKTMASLTELYKPIVNKHMNQVGAAQQFDKLNNQYKQIPLVPDLDFSPDGYVTKQALNGLFSTLGAIEKDIRANPSARTTALLQKVFAK